MVFHTFGNEKAPIVLFIHGTLTPWQMWEKQIEHFQKQYFVIVPALDAHIEEEPSEFISISLEAKKIEAHIEENYGRDVFAVCGLSMGGAIAIILFGNGILKIKHLVLDGAPLVPSNALLNKIMTGFYTSIIHKSKARDPKTLGNFKRNFLPEKYLDSYLRLADNMSDDSIKNMIDSIGQSKLAVTDNKHGTKILFLHGTKSNELLSKKSAALTKKHYPDAKVLCFKGYAHAELAIYKTEKWIEVVDDFLFETT